MKIKGFNFSVNEISGRTFELPYNKAIDFIKSNCPDKNIDFDNIEEYELAELLWNYCYEDIEKYARQLQAMGAVNVLVSMAGDGAMLIDEFGKTHRCGVCKGIVKNSVGAGDSMVAGFMAGSLNGDYKYALKLGTAAGGATAFSHGLATKEKISELLKTL